MPDSDRPRRTAAKEGTANIALGALGAVLLVVVVTVLTQNQITGHRSDLARAESEAATATRQATALSTYGTFAQTKQTRQQSISQLADGRFDWERFMRELALVLPAGTSIQSAAGAASGSAEGGSPAGDPSATGEDSTEPSVNLKGCAKSQPDVATLMVRLRSMYRAEDVELNDSSRSTAGGSGAASGSASAGGGGGTSCSGSQYTFDATVTFATDTQGTAKERKVPPTLGGGA